MKTNKKIPSENEGLRQKDTGASLKELTKLELFEQDRDGIGFITQWIK